MVIRFRGRHELLNMFCQLPYCMTSNQKLLVMSTSLKLFDADIAE